MQPVVIPSVGVGMSEALLLRWLKAPGESVETGEAVAEIETDKATLELASPAEGVLGSHLFDPDAIVPVGVAVAFVLEGDESEEGVESAPAAPSASAATADSRSGSSPAPDAEVTAEPRHRRSPRARAAATSDSGASGRYRDLIAARVSESWTTIPHFTVAREIDAEALLAVVGRSRSDGVEVSVTDLLLRALALAWSKARGDSDADFGLAVATGRGVVIPVIGSVCSLDLRALSSARERTVERARAGGLAAEDFEGDPVATLSNLGSYGVDWFTAVIPTGQTCILSVGRARRRPVAGPDGIESRATCQVTLSVDHRIFDGADAAQVLSSFADVVEDEHQLLASEKDSL